MNTENITDKTGHEILQVISKADHFNEWMYQTIRPFLKGHILEIGSGIGNISQYFVRSGAHISLSDIDPYYVAILKNRFSANVNVESILSIDLLHENFEEVYAAFQKKFDSVFLLNVLEHLKDDLQAIKNGCFLLKPGGTLLILVPAYTFFYSKMDKELGHYRRYTDKKLQYVLRGAGLTITKSFYFNLLGISAWFYGKLLRLQKIPQGEMKLFNKVVALAKWLDAMVGRRVGLSVIAVAKNGEEKN